MQIRIAKTGDAASIASLGKQTFTETFGHLFRDEDELHFYLQNTFSTAKISSSLNKPNNVFWIAFVEKKAVGYAKLKLDSPSPFIEEKKVSQLQKIYVLKEYLSMKIGFKLQDALLSKAKEKGADTIWLSVLISNERAIGFYLKNGFELIGNHDYQIGKERFNFKAMAKKL